MQQGHPPTRHDEIDRDAVRDRDGEQDAGSGGDPAVHAFDLDPSAGRPDGLDDDTVHLVAEDDRVESRQRAAEGAPPAHHFGYRGVGPEAEVEPPARLAAAAGDAGDDTVAAPVGELIERESADERHRAE